MVVLAIGSAFISQIVFLSTIKLSQRLVYNLSLDFFSKLQRLSLSFYTKNQTGDILQRMNGDVFVIYFLVAQIILPIITSLTCIAAMLYIMVKIDITLALLSFSVVPLLGIIIAFFAKPMSDTSMIQNNRQSQVSSFVQQSLLSIKITQAFNRESYMHQKLQKHAQELGSAFVIANKVAMTYNQLTFLITSLVSALVIGFGAYRGLNGVISIGDLFIFLGYIAGFYGPVNSLSTAIGTAITVSARGRRIFDIVDCDEIVNEKRNAADLPVVKGAVEFKNVSFGYDRPDKTSVPALRNISFNITPGQIIAIVGPTGAGKTSLISLLTRFYDPWEGEILVDGIDIRNVKLHSLRENISLVMQDPFLFPVSVGENIAFGNPQASFDEIVEAAKSAQAHDFIQKLPNGYDTVLSETGTSLSGGERQRIGIARAFLKNAPILILDEPTSAVDASTEAKIFESLARRFYGKTVFVITHRLSTIKNSDQIITIKNGQVAEYGTHKSLLEKGTVYADLYRYHHIS
jgi:ABC-type multidrug transport system fused ATPase/permease subunit